MERASLTGLASNEVFQSLDVTKNLISQLYYHRYIEFCGTTIFMLVPKIKFFPKNQ